MRRHRQVARVFTAAATAAWGLLAGAPPAARAVAIQTPLVPLAFASSGSIMAVGGYTFETGGGFNRRR